MEEETKVKGGNCWKTKTAQVGGSLQTPNTAAKVSKPDAARLNQDIRDRSRDTYLDKA